MSTENEPVETAPELPKWFREPDAGSAMNAGAAILAEEEAEACADAEEAAEVSHRERFNEQLAELGAKLAALSPDDRARIAARLGGTRDAVRLINDLMARE